MKKTTIFAVVLVLLAYYVVFTLPEAQELIRLDRGKDSTIYYAVLCAPKPIQLLEQNEGSKIRVFFGSTSPLKEVSVTKTELYGAYASIIHTTAGIFTRYQGGRYNFSPNPDYVSGSVSGGTVWAMNSKPTTRTANYIPFYGYRLK